MLAFLSARGPYSNVTIKMFLVKDRNDTRPTRRTIVLVLASPISFILIHLRFAPLHPHKRHANTIFRTYESTPLYSLSLCREIEIAFYRFFRESFRTLLHITISRGTLGESGKRRKILLCIMQIRFFQNLHRSMIIHRSLCSIYTDIIPYHIRTVLFP